VVGLPLRRPDETEKLELRDGSTEPGLKLPILSLGITIRGPGPEIWVGIMTLNATHQKYDPKVPMYSNPI